jgi:hypothetical protein
MQRLHERGRNPRPSGRGGCQPACAGSAHQGPGCIAECPVLSWRDLVAGGWSFLKGVADFVEMCL